MSVTKEPKKKGKIGSILAYVACGILALVIVYEIVLKVTHNSVYLFGIRSDVVLTDSMSYKNEEPEIQSFLKDHNDQLQVGDLVYSVKVDEKMDLNVYDVVVFNHPDTGKLTIHRIVDIDTTRAEPRYVIRADTANAASYDGALPRSMIVAKKVAFVPWLGHIVNFLKSIWGMILMIGIIVIILVYDFLKESKWFKEKPKTENPQK